MGVIVHSGRGHRGTLLSAFEASCLQPLGSNPWIAFSVSPRKMEGRQLHPRYLILALSVQRQQSAVTPGTGSVIPQVGPGSSKWTLLQRGF